MAYELEETFHLDFDKTLRFVSKHPRLSKEELIDLYFGKAHARRGCNKN